MKQITFFATCLIAIICMGLASCSKDDDNKDDGNKESTVTITNKSSSTLTDITFICYSSDNEDAEEQEQTLRSLKKGASHSFEFPAECDTWFLVCNTDEGEYESDDYTAKSLTITDKTISGWYAINH